MRSKNTAMKLACILGSFAFLMAIVAYAVIISQGNFSQPSGGSGPRISATFEWLWGVTNDRAHSINATANPENCQFMRQTPGPDIADYSNNPASVTHTIGAGKTWSNFRSRTCDVMESGNNYYWKWNSWPVDTTTNDSGSAPGGSGSTYNCN